MSLYGWNRRVMMTVLAVAITAVLMVLLNGGATARHRAPKSRDRAFLDGAAESGALAEGADRMDADR
jgi:hypothetical protein